MHGFDFIFDKEQNRIGMVEANCTRNKEENNINNDNDINNEINVDNFDSDEISNNISNISDRSNNISRSKINYNKKKFIINNEEYSFDNSMIKICYYVICATFILFVIFNIILCKDNYNVIQQRKDDEDIDKFVMENYRHDINIGPISLFNDNI